MRHFPAFFDLRNSRVLVVGGGEVALRKIQLLEKCGALVHVVAKTVLAEIETRARLGAFEVSVREFEPADLDGVRMAFAATQKRAVNRWIANLAEARRIPINVVDDLEHSRFIVPALVDRDPVLIAISTAGASPVLARRLRERLEAWLPARIGELALWLRELRSAALERLRDLGERRRYFENILDGNAGARFLSGDRQGAERTARQLLAVRSAAAPPEGEVVLVGAGPGDPELLTLKALRALQDADVILHDRLVSAAVLERARRDAILICVGKEARGPRTEQDQINALMIEHARLGRRVVRLKGGDPFIFGRGGEELQALRAAGIAFSVVPGVTAALGAAAYAGIPLTHRDHSHAVTFVTGHEDRAGHEPDWRALAGEGQTIVFYMPLARIAQIAAQLMAHGAPPTRPAALIARATDETQRVLISELLRLADDAARAQLRSPATLIVGDTAALAAELAWFKPAAENAFERRA